MARRLEAHGMKVMFASSSELTERFKPYNYPFTKLPTMRIDYDPEPGYELVYKEALQSLDADTFIIDTECPVYIITGIAIDKRVFILNHFLPLPTRPDSPIPNLDIAPGEGIQGSTWVIPLGYGVKRLKHFLKALREKRRAKGKDRRSLLINLASHLGLKKSDYLYSRSISPGPYLYFSNLPILHITAEELDFKHYLRPLENYVGPMVFLDRKGDAYPGDQEKLLDLIQRTKSLNKPLIYCALSSLKAVENSFIEKILDAYEGEKLEVVVGLGEQSEIPLRAIPENIHFFEWVDAQIILPHADVAVITAGFHTIHECLYFEVPMISFSFSTTDQNGFQARIRSKKIGLNGDFVSETAESLRSKTHQLLESEEHKLALAKMKKSLEKYVQDMTFEKLISEKAKS